MVSAVPHILSTFAPMSGIIYMATSVQLVYRSPSTLYSEVVQLGVPPKATNIDSTEIPNMLLLIFNIQRKYVLFCQDCSDRMKTYIHDTTLSFTGSTHDIGTVIYDYYVYCRYISFQCYTSL